MKKDKKFMKNLVERIAVKIATVEANTACPFITHQPSLPQSVKNLRRF